MEKEDLIPFSRSEVLEYLKKDLQEVGVPLSELLPWLADPPRVSTFRVNTLVISVQEAQEILEANLKKVAEERGIPDVPRVRRVPDLDDVLMIDSWKVDSAQILSEPRNREVVVDAPCGCALLRGAHVFAPGILSMSKGVAVGQTVDVFADLDGKCLQGSLSYEGRKRFVGRGEVKMCRNQLFGTSEKPRGVAIEMLSTPSGCPSISAPPHVGMLQNLPSALASWELRPAPGETVLDMCAAPGNKTSHLAALMQNQGVLVALDRTEKKILQVRDTCQKLSAECLTFAIDSTKAVATSKDRDILLGPPFSPATFDKILLDAPCSALGQRPQLLNRVSLSQLRSHSALQRRLLDAAVNLLKPGGELVYSTCSVSHSENEGLVAWALRRYSYLVLVPPRHRFTPVVTVQTPSAISLSNELRANVQRFGPPSKSSAQYCDSIGFFIARFKKRLYF